MVSKKTPSSYMFCFYHSLFSIFFQSTCGSYIVCVCLSLPWFLIHAPLPASMYMHISFLNGKDSTGAIVPAEDGGDHGDGENENPVDPVDPVDPAPLADSVAEASEENREDDDEYEPSTPVADAPDEHGSAPASGVLSRGKSTMEIEVAVNDSSDEDMNEDMDDIPPTQVVPDPESSATALPDGKEESEYDMYTPEDKKLPLYPNPEMEAEKTAKRATQKSLKNKKAFEEIPSEGFDSSVSLETMEEELARLMEQRDLLTFGLISK